MVPSSWPRATARDQPVHLMNADCRMLPTLRPSQRHWACESAGTGSYYPHPPSPLIISTPEDWYSFYRLTFFDSPCTYYKTAIDQGPKSDRPHHAHTRWTPPLKQKSQLPHKDCATRLVRRKKCCTNVRKSLRKKHICLRRYGSIKS